MRWLGWLLAIVMVLPLATLLVLYTPPMQRYAVEHLSAWLTKRTGVMVHVGTVRIEFPLRIEVSDLQIGNLLKVDEAGTKICLQRLRKGVVGVEYVYAEGIKFDSDTLDTSLSTAVTAQELQLDDITYRWREDETHVRSVFLSDGDIELLQRTARTAKDTLLGQLPFSLNISEVHLQRIRANYTNAPLQLTTLTDDIVLHNIFVDTLLQVTLESLKIEDGTVTLARQGGETWEATQLMARADEIDYTLDGFEGQLTQLRFIESHGFHMTEGMASVAWHEGEIGIPIFSFSTEHSIISGQLRSLNYGMEDIHLDCEATLQLGYPDALRLSQGIKGAPREFIELYPTETLHVSAAVKGTTEHLLLKQCALSLPTAFDIHMDGELHHPTLLKDSKIRCQWKANTYDLDFLEALTGNTQIAIPHDMEWRGSLLYTPDTMHTQCSLAFQEGAVSLEASYRTVDEVYALRVRTDSFDVTQLLPSEEIGVVSAQAEVKGRKFNNPLEGSLYSDVKLHTLQWRDYTLSNATAQVVLEDSTLNAQAVCHDSLMQWRLTTSVRQTTEMLCAKLHACIDDIDLQALQITNTSLRPSLQCSATLSIDSTGAYALHSEFSDIALSTPKATLHPRPISLDAQWIDDTALLAIKTEGIASTGLNIGDIALTARYATGRLSAQLHTAEVTWQTPQFELQGRANGTLQWGGTFVPDSLSGVLCLTSAHCTLPTYSLQFSTTDTLSIPLERGMLTLNSLPIHAYGKRPLLLDGSIALFNGPPNLQLQLIAHDVDLLLPYATHEALLYGKALIRGDIKLSGEPNALAIGGTLQLLSGSSIHYIYKDAILTANNQMESIVTFVNLETGNTSAQPSKEKFYTSSLSININLSVDPTAELEVSLGQSRQNYVQLQGGGTLNLQYSPTDGVLLSGRYTIEKGDMTMNIPLLHVSHMHIRPESTVTWTGNPQNPQINISAEERIRASVTLDGEPESVLFVTGVSITNTMDKLGVQFTLSAPENASMQNTLIALSNEERSKLAVALLTTGLYLGEGGTGSLMNTALMSLLQSQLDNLSRDAFRTVDVSIGIDPVFDGVSGVSTRTDYTFSLAKRLWNDRLRIIIGGSVTTNNQHIESDAIIDNISLEWRISPVGNQILRFFYDNHYENILEGEVREMGVGYAYRKQF